MTYCAYRDLFVRGVTRVRSLLGFFFYSDVEGLI